MVQIEGLGVAINELVDEPDAPIFVSIFLHFSHGGGYH